MVYTAMKMFMEINPQLFDDCSHEYREFQGSAEAREKIRQQKWDRLKHLAKSRKDNTPANAIPPSSAGQANSENFDPMTQDSQQRLHALKLQDETSAGKDRRLEGQNSVSASQDD